MRIFKFNVLLKKDCSAVDAMAQAKEIAAFSILV